MNSTPATPAPLAGELCAAINDAVDRALDEFGARYERIDVTLGEDCGVVDILDVVVDLLGDEHVCLCHTLVAGKAREEDASGPTEILGVVRRATQDTLDRFGWGSVSRPAAP